LNSKLLGRWGEACAAGYLKKNGYNVIGMSYSCRYGEIDIICDDNKYIVFVEVKLRKNNKYGEAREFVSVAKQRKIILTAQTWLSLNPSMGKQPRFDVIEIYAADGVNTKDPVINHIENAFGEII